MKNNKKVFMLGMVLLLTFSSSIFAEENTVNNMEVKLAKIEVSIGEERVNLFQREMKLNEMKVKSLGSEKIDQKSMAIKLAEIESALAKDKLLLSKREVKLYEMKLSLMSYK